MKSSCALSFSGMGRGFSEVVKVGRWRWRCWKGWGWGEGAGAGVRGVLNGILRLCLCVRVRVRNEYGGSNEGGRKGFDGGGDGSYICV